MVECTSEITRKTETREVKRNGVGTHSLHRTGGDDEEGVNYPVNYPVPITLRIFDFAFSSHTSVEFRPLYHPGPLPLLHYYFAAHETTERKHQSQIIIDVSLNTP